MTSNHIVSLIETNLHILLGVETLAEVVVWIQDELVTAGSTA